jgi:hypothetical protein
LPHDAALTKNFYFDSHWQRQSHIVHWKYISERKALRQSIHKHLLSLCVVNVFVWRARIVVARKIHGLQMMAMQPVKVLR